MYFSKFINGCEIHSTYIWREKDTFIQIFTSVSCAQDSTDKVNHALICPWKLYRFLHVPALLYTGHSYKQHFHKLYLSFLGSVRVLKKSCWREKCLPTQQGHKKIKVSISSKPLLKFSFHFYKHLKNRSLWTDQCQILSVVLKAESSSDDDFLTLLSFKECTDGIRLVLALLPYIYRNLLHAAILLCAVIWNYMALNFHGVSLC